MTSTQVCFNCDAVMEPMVSHNCIKGLTENINRLHSNLNGLLVKKTDHLEGLKFALEIVSEAEDFFKSRGYDYPGGERNPFHYIENEIRANLDLKLKAI